MKYIWIAKYALMVWITEIPNERWKFWAQNLSGNPCSKGQGTGIMIIFDESFGKRRCQTVKLSSRHITSSVKKSISDFFLGSDRMKSLKRFVMFWMRIQRWEPSTSWPWLHMIHCDSIMSIMWFDRHVWSFTPPLWHKLSDSLVPACYSC